ncbi:hypothetical protein SAMN04489761_4370 [Tenacibaculum sp. MAR_2009_124]|uniref:DUF5995 family protein n=1 Tax=Tenacibaculum sp. MAR_2009_124 TaxID=1250059 RepID=UPI00089B3227|nr:DUF5995 family protein [Tenacibaculum sp. MAR_2009_124]SED13087.1 hypothetical protein SAMN04489761_4370 [Tenacibaculum sp. MAR_2009_124]
MPPINTIDDVISTLQKIVDDSIKNESTLGYFAALYLNVTIKVKEGIENDYFENGERMEKLDVIFAKRYIQAYFDFKENKPTTFSWKKAFDITNKFWYIVLQHLLIGMNAHINLDLGIASAEVMKGQNIEDLKTDFNRINKILSSLVHEVEEDLSEIWPFLKTILRFTHKIDSFLIDFSMKLARDGAWKFAVKLASSPQNITNALIEEQDLKVAEKASIITKPGIIIQLIFMFIRIGEKGSIADKIRDLSEK